MFTDDGHAEVGAVATTERLGEGIAEVTRRIGPAPGFGEQGLPLFARATPVIPVGARVLAAVVEKADVVVGGFERLDFALDEIVQFLEIGRQFGRYVEVHETSLSSSRAMMTR